MSSNYSSDEISSILLKIVNNEEVFNYGNSIIPEFKRLGILPDETPVVQPCDET